MPEFLSVAVVLILLASVFLFMPLMMNRSEVKSSRSGINVALYKSRLEELESDFSSDLIDEDEFRQLKTELERRLLDDAAAVDSGGTNTGKPSIKLALVFALFIPVLAVVVYHNTGAKADWDIAQTLKQTRHKAAAGEGTEQDVEKLVEQLSDRLAQRPEDPHYLMLMASTQMELQNYPAATDAYQRLSMLYPEDPSVLANYAQALYLASGRSLSDSVKKVANRALAINAQQPTVLGMLGIASFEAGEFQQAIGYWERLLPMLGPVSPNRKMIMTGIEQARAQLIASGVEVAAPADTVQAGKGASLQLQVAMGENITADEGDTVFVFARAAVGPRMPLAVARIKVADLPASITLNDSMAMAPGMKLSSFEQVEVVARISKNGIANPSSGDIEGKLGPIEVAATTETLTLLINQVVP